MLVSLSLSILDADFQLIIQRLKDLRTGTLEARKYENDDENDWEAQV